MNPSRGKATRTASNAGAAAPKVSARSAKGSVTKPTESRVVTEAAQPKAQRCGSTRASGSQRKKNAPGPLERPGVGARGAASKEALLNAAEVAVDCVAALVEGPDPPSTCGPSLPRAGSRRDRGARAARERRPPPAPTEEPGRLSLVRAPSLCQEKVVSQGRKFRAVLDKLRLTLPEISAAAEIVNKVVDHLLRRLRSFESEFKGVTLLHSGSYYEHVKVSCLALALLATRRPASSSLCQPR